jgi:hypothetical protein
VPGLNADRPVDGGHPATIHLSRIKGYQPLPIVSRPRRHSKTTQKQRAKQRAFDSKGKR